MARLETWITTAWYRGSGWLWLLWPLSSLVAWIARRRRYRYLSEPPPAFAVPVVVVGGITVGGTGKTPVLIALVKALTTRGLRVGVVSRGYGGSAGAGPMLVDARATAAMVGDEPLLIALSASCPVVVGSDRVAAVNKLLELEPLDLVLSDDGLQHYAMHRDFEIAVLDRDRALGNRQLLPMGPLREPAGRLEDVDWLLVRNGDQPDTGFRYHLSNFRHWRTRAVLTGKQAVERWSQGTVAAATALGQPEQFFAGLEALGLEVMGHPYPDHQPLKKQDLDKIWGDVIVITEKDAVKIESFDDDRIWVMAITAQVPAALVDTLVEQFGRH